MVWVNNKEKQRGVSTGVDDAVLVGQLFTTCAVAAATLITSSSIPIPSSTIETALVDSGAVCDEISSVIVGDRYGVTADGVHFADCGTPTNPAVVRPEVVNYPYDQLGSDGYHPGPHGIIEQTTGVSMGDGQFGAFRNQMKDGGPGLEVAVFNDVHGTPPIPQRPISTPQRPISTPPTTFFDSQGEHAWHSGMTNVNRASMESIVNAGGHNLYYLGSVLEGNKPVGRKDDQLYRSVNGGLVPVPVKPVNRQSLRAKL